MLVLQISGVPSQHFHVITPEFRNWVQGGAALAADEKNSVARTAAAKIKLNFVWRVNCAICYCCAGAWFVWLFFVAAAICIEANRVSDSVFTESQIFCEP